ncbi:F-box protein At5g39450 [Andrographis paniculata]|uniref:F-box protein At5g39450 n=1 Tax=Andrographis paniculata TaxID=175694 RepID=UPI0021E8075F|nr:F-box protein At5g39450 [Andrographis paniculata]
MSPDLCGSSLLLSLPDDVFSVITASLSPRDVCSLGLTCRDLNLCVASDKVWLFQCDKLGMVQCPTLIEWRKGVSSFKSLCRFLLSVRPLMGIWVHQNPELGNVVYIMPGFLSVVACRIIPQEVGPLGLEDGPILWTPVFEIICNHEGSSAFFLHGRERGIDYVYPGFLKSADGNWNVLLLEVESRHKRNGGKLAYSKSFANEADEEVSCRLSRSNTRASKSQRIVGQKGPAIPFSRLAFGDRRRLLDVVTSQVRLIVPSEANGLLFPHLRKDDADWQRDVALLHERRSLLLQMYKRRGAGNHGHMSDLESPLNPTELGTSEICKRLDCVSGYRSSRGGDEGQAPCTKGRTLSGFLRNGIKQILGKSSATTNSSSRELHKKLSSASEAKHVQLHEFLQSGDTIGLCLRAVTMKLSSYRAWPNMHDSRFALYKLPVCAPKPGHEYAGLWGGTFGWPPGKPSEDKPGKALFFILISYEESEGQRLLIGTKILEGTSYVLHPNGSAMFIVNIDQPSTDTFPWDTDEDSNHIDVKQSYLGEGIANGYGFRYPGSKPGSLFVIQNGLMVFLWRESRAVLVLRRLDLADLLRKGERMPSLSPVSNFAYLTKTYSNVFSGFSNSSNTLR